MKRAAIIVLDGLGIGESPSTARYGDAGSDTLGNVARAVGGLALPNLERLGLGCCRSLAGRRGSRPPPAATGDPAPPSAGNDSTPGAWEVWRGLLVKAFRTYT